MDYVPKKYQIIQFFYFFFYFFGLVAIFEVFVHFLQIAKCIGFDNFWKFITLFFPTFVKHEMSIIDSNNLIKISHKIKMVQFWSSMLIHIHLLSLAYWYYFEFYIIFPLALSYT